MYIDKIVIKNFGPIQNTVISCPFDEEIKPLPLILVGTNGSGKTSILANIIDSLVELKRKKYVKLQEVEENNYLKVGKKNYITSGKEYSYVNIKTVYGDNNASFVDFARSISKEDFDKKFDKDDFENINWQDQKLVSNGYFKHINANDAFLETFEKEVLLFFPFSRYEIPAWWHPDHDLGFNFKEKYIGVSDRNFIKNNVVKEIEEWILNVFLDAEIYEKTTIDLGQLKDKDLGPALVNSKLLLGYGGKNTTLKTSINELLTTLYKAKDPSIENVRLGISDKNYRRISVICKKDGVPEIEIAPTISHLSSGELMIFSLFCSILKEYDQLNIGDVVDLTEIKGTIIIDEIDLHLHIDLQKKLLPSLIKKFPKIQFIITTHSPLFLIGIEESFEGLEAVNLPQGNLIPLSEFSEVEKAFDLFVDKFSVFRKSYQMALEKINDLTVPLVITEGKTDWKHFKKALERFKVNGEFSKLNFEFLEYEDETPMGDKQLLTLCEQFKKTKQPKKIICIFDRDNSDITKKISDPYYDFGNNVYAFCIEKPAHRVDYNNISIEFLYTDEELKTKDENSKSILFTNEVVRRTTQPMSQMKPKIEYVLLDESLNEDEPNKKIYDQDVSKVIDAQGEYIGISKSVFAQYVMDEKAGFNDFDIEPFRRTFEIIAEII